ncbi:MAG: DUF1566 domain-containing protein, partial [bacterium]|nr:DUF1566 domain-containing protein [bacterium]
RNYLDRRSLKKRLGAELYTQQDILRATKYYIKPNCQDVDPSQEEDIRAVHAVKNKLFEKMDELLKNHSKFKYLIVLADSGMGKTAFVLNYYARHWRSSARRRKFKIALVPLGIKDAESHVKNIKDRSNTVLFLDAFDEDARAIKNHRLRLANLLGLCNDFRKVLITSRTQFFEREEEIPRETGIARIGVTSAGENREYVFYKLYLSPFSDVQVKKYLRRRFNFWQRKKCHRASEIVAQIPQLTVRPMLLAHIHELVQTPKQYGYSFQIYEEMVDAWLERERPFVKDKTELRKFSEQLAINLFQKWSEGKSERVPYSELEPLARSFGINLQDWQLRGRSLLNRDVAGNYKFAHRSIMEYLFVKRFLELKTQDRFKIDWTDQMKKFLKEILAFHHDRKSPPPNLTLVDLEGVLMFRSYPATLSDHQVRTMLKNYNFFDSSWNKSGSGFKHKFEAKTINGKKVVIDRASGLMWQQGGSSDSMLFKKTKSWIAELNRQRYAGFSDWRLPTLEEAMSLMEPDKMNGDLYIDPIFDSNQRWIWTCDLEQGGSSAWVVGFDDGRCYYGQFHYYDYYSVRAVRFGQSSP